MATSKPKASSRAHDAHYHAVKASAAWKTFVASQVAAAKDPPGQRAERDEQRERETTYARGELGGS